jgi:NADH dehydrogenase [ubiquinone] 1 alpha subcomplex assembly factor 5
MNDAVPPIFDAKRRMAMRARAVDRGIGQSFLLEHMADELTDRLACVTRTFEKVLIVGPIAQFASPILGNRIVELTADIMADEERLAYPPASFDLILSAGTLDSVNDLPGALIQMRRALVPDGLFLGTLFGAGSLATLKSALLVAGGNAARAHIHPQIDLRAISDLMSRAGFALPVCDLDRLELRYADWRRLVEDVRDAGAGNCLANARYFDRDLPKILDEYWNTHASDDGRVTETMTFLQLSGWSPSPAQAKPARRGSGQVSLADLFPAKSS